MLCKKTNIAKHNYFDSITIFSKKINNSKRYITRTNIYVRVSRKIFAITNKFDSITNSIKTKQQ